MSKLGLVPIVTFRNPNPCLPPDDGEPTDAYIAVTAVKLPSVRRKTKNRSFPEYVVKMKGLTADGGTRELAIEALKKKIRDEASGLDELRAEEIDV